MWLKQCHKPSPSHHHFYRWYQPFPTGWFIIVLPTLVEKIVKSCHCPMSNTPSKAMTCRCLSADHESPRHLQPPQIPTGPPPAEHWVASPDRPTQSPRSSRWSSNKTPRTNLRRQNYGGKWIGLREKIQDTHHISWENPWFPAGFPLSQSIECWKRNFSSKWREWFGIAYSNQKNSEFNHEFWPRMEPSAPHLL